MRRLPLTNLPAGQIPSSVVVVGDPGRVKNAAGLLDSAELVSDKREYLCYSGRFSELPIAVCSHGIGASGAAIAFEELIEAGAKRIVRVGTCGALQPEMTPGDLIIVTAAVQNTGYGAETVPVGYPAVADLETTLALKRAITGPIKTANIGIVLSRDNFYRGVNVANSPNYAVMSQANVLAVEMECAALFIVGSLRKVRVGAIAVVDGNVLLSYGEKMESYAPDDDKVKNSVMEALKIAFLALKWMEDEFD